MAIVDMDPNAARSWINGIDSLNAELESVMKGTQTSVQTVQQSSQGSVVDELCSGIDEMTGAINQMVSGFGNLVQSVVRVVGVAAEHMDEIAAVAGGVAKILAIL